MILARRFVPLLLVLPLALHSTTVSGSLPAAPQETWPAKSHKKSTRGGRRRHRDPASRLPMGRAAAGARRQARRPVLAKRRQ